MQTKTTTTTTPEPKPDAQPVQAAIPARPNLGAPASAWADYHAAISAAGIRFQDKLDADFVAKAQPVQAETAEAMSLRMNSPQGLAEFDRMTAEEREAQSAAYEAALAREAFTAEAARMRAKAQPMQIIITFRPLAAFISAPPPQVVTGDEEFLTAVTAAVKDNPSVGSVSVPE